MYAVAWSVSAGAITGGTGLPFFQLGSVELPVHLGPIHEIQWFGIIVAAGVLIGASLLRRYAEWHGVADANIRGLTGWVTIAGFLGAHIFDVLAYQWKEFTEDPVLLLKVWSGISSYGGFIGGAVGFALFVWWKRLPARLMADIAIVGLLPAFSIGRIGCTVVSDHIGAAVDPDKWYAFLALDYPRALNLGHLADTYPGTSEFIRAWNLGLIELLYLIPVNAVFLYLAFKSSKRLNTGFLTVMTGVLYAPVRFFLDFLRPEETDPRHFGLTFAQVELVPRLRGGDLLRHACLQQRQAGRDGYQDVARGPRPTPRRASRGRREGQGRDGHEVKGAQDHEAGRGRFGIEVQEELEVASWPRRLWRAQCRQRSDLSRERIRSRTCDSAADASLATAATHQ